MLILRISNLCGFQSTLPVGGATTSLTIFKSIFRFQSTLPVGGATTKWRCLLVRRKFQSTLPVGGATWQMYHRTDYQTISIHAPRGGSDYFYVCTLFVAYDFNPRSPWGERPIRVTGQIVCF